MNALRRLALATLVMGMFAGAAWGDGMIVPIRPDIRVQGNWAVKYHHVTMTVRDQVASVSIDQEFINTGNGMIEVEYLFPVPPDAAIDSMTLVVDGKEMVAKLLPADEARKIYEDIVRRKKDPALLEYAGFGLYRTKAFPLEPGKPAKVLVHYEYVCKKDRDLVEVWYPLNTEKFSAKPIEDVKVTVDIKADSDITAVYSPTHDLDVDRKDPRRVVATYHEKNALPANDFQVFYKAADEDVAATLLTYQPNAAEDGYFLMLVSPNPRTSDTKIVPKDVVIVLDRSGSMSGEKIAQARDAARFILKNLNEHDRFQVIAYNDSVEPFFDHQREADQAAIAEAMEMVDGITAGGGTNIHEALAQAMKGWMHLSDERPRYVIFLTDGLPTVGNTNEADILKDTADANTAGARLFAFGVGYDVNVRLLDKLAAENTGKSDYVRPNENIEGKIASLYAKIKNPVMTELAARIEGLKLKDMYPRELGDLFEGDQIVAVGRYAKDGDGARDATLTVTGTYEGKPRGFEYPVRVNAAGEGRRFAFVERLWAVRRVGWLMDQIQLHGENKEVVDELVALSTRYGIITPYTSFLADERTNLADDVAVGRLMERQTRRLQSDVSGYAGQNAAMTRQKLSAAKQAPAPSSSMGGVAMVGNVSQDAYEAGEAESVTTVRQAGNQAIYRRDGVWVAANAKDVDPKAADGNVQVVERFSDEYFALVRANSTEENQVLASQQGGEELLIRLRGQVYRIK